MAATKLLLSQSRRHLIARAPVQFTLSRRWFPSESDPNPAPAPNPRAAPVLVQRVSYAPNKRETELLDYIHGGGDDDGVEGSVKEWEEIKMKTFRFFPENRVSENRASENRAMRLMREEELTDYPTIRYVGPLNKREKELLDYLNADDDGVEATEKQIQTYLECRERIEKELDDDDNIYDEEKIWKAIGKELKRTREIEVENRMRRWRRGIEQEHRRTRKIVQRQEMEVVPFPRSRLIVPAKKTEKRPLLELMDAIRQVKANSRTTFDETIEAHARLGINKSRSDLIVRGTLTLPHGGDKVLKVAFFAEGAEAEEARAAGADIVGGVELIEEILSAGKVDFDKCYTTRQLYPRVAKQGTVVNDVTRAVKAAKQNEIKFRMAKSSIVRVGLGKASFSDESLCENICAFMNALLQSKPAGLKKTSKYAGYVNSFHICSTMGEKLPVSIQSLSKAVDHFNKVQLKS